MPTLEEIFGKEKPSLDDIFKGNKQVETQPTQQPQEDEGILSDIAGGLKTIVTAPASAALDVISYLDKPRGAIAGAVSQYLHDDTPSLSEVMEGAKKGWSENTSWKAALPDDFKKENPITSNVAGFVGDVVLDPAWLLTPAKIGAGLAKGSKVVGLTDKVINPATKAFKASEVGQKIIANAEDFVGVNRVAAALDDFKLGRAADDVARADVADEIKALKKTIGSEADDVAKYVEAADRPVNSTVDAMQSIQKGDVFKDIKAGKLSREEAIDAYKKAGQEIPDTLLQTHQQQAKLVGGEIPDFVYRDQILNSIPDETVRKQIQTIGDKVIAKNKEIADTLYSTGRLGDEQLVEFLNGSHLRRSYEKFDNADDFLKAVRKNGTEDEWKRAYTNYQKNNSGVGPSAAHKVDQRDFMRRQNLSEDTMKKMGVISDAEYRVSDTLNRGSKAIREDEFLARVNNMFGKTADEAAELSRSLPKAREYVPIPEAKSYGKLAGKWVPKDVANQVMGVMGTKPDNLNKTWQKMVSYWKVGKLANPSSIMRNFYSGLPMANAFGNVPLKNIPVEMARVTKAFANGGKNNPLIREIRASGALEGKWIRSELDTILKGNKKGIGKYAEKGMEAFGAPDEFWRAVVYSYHRGRGASVKEAGKIARKALLDYSSSPEWINTLGKSGIVPFARFPFLAGKETAKTLWKNPASITKYTKAQNQVNNSDREQLLPDYMKARTLLPVGNTTRMVNGKPQKVQQNIDLSYILPFANDFTAGNPVMDAIMLHRTGMNGLGQKVIKPGMTDTEKAKAYAEYYGNSLLPTIISPYTVNRLKNGFQGNVDKMGRQYDAQSAIAQTLLGVKNVPINTDEMFQNKMMKIKADQNNAKIMINSIRKDASMSTKQKKELIADHISQIQELQKEAIKTQQAYKNEKSRGK